MNLNISNEIYQRQCLLSKYNGQFLDYVLENPDALKAVNYKDMNLDDKLFTLQPWPTFINNKTEAQFREASESILKLITSIPRRIFGNDYQKVSKYFKIPAHLAKIQLEGVTDDHLESLLARGDFLWSTTGLKCLEYNITANLGGWQLPIWETILLANPIITTFLKKNNIQIKNKSLIHKLLLHILESSLRLHGADTTDEINIAEATVIYKEDGISRGNFLTARYREVLEKYYPHIKGEIFCIDFPLMEIRDDYVYYKGKKIHSLVEMRHGFVSPQVFEVFKKGNLRLFDGPVSSLLANKLTLAILSSYRDLPENTFTEEEKRHIDNYIPWSRKIGNVETTYGSDKINLCRFIEENRDRLVMKPGIGYGGKGVYVGRNCSASEWQELIQMALRQEHWLVQEFVQTHPTLYQSGRDGADLHSLVWGIFVLGSRYSGSWARVLPIKDDKGVINCHQGARVSLVLEVDDPDESQSVNK